MKPTARNLYYLCQPKLTHGRWLIAGILALSCVGQATASGIVQRISGADGGWDYVTVDAASNRLFVARTDGTMTVDLATGKVTDKFVSGARLHAAFIAAGIGVTTNGGTNTATLFDPATGAVRAEVATGKKPDAAVYDPANGTVWTMNAGDGTATIIDLKAAKSIGTMTIGGALEFAVVDGKGHLFVNVEDKNELAEIDIARRVVLRRTLLKGCEEPSGLGLTGHGVLISACANGVAKATDAASGKALPDIAIGKHPDAVLIDLQRSRAYVPAGEGMLTVIDISARVPRKLVDIPTQAGARTGAVDPATGKVYLPAARYAPAVAGERPKAVPGSFEILVVEP